jgi:hypothetical protein
MKSNSIPSNDAWSSEDQDVTVLSHHSINDAMDVQGSQLSFSFAWGLGASSEKTASPGELGEPYLSPLKAKQLKHALKVTGEPVGMVSGCATFVRQAVQAIKDE